LFFFQIFLTFTNNGDDVFGHSLTNGPNGILNVDELSFFGWSLPTTTAQGQFAIAYLYAAVVLFGIVYVALRLLNDSRTGRAWRSLREDPLAAELMGMPVNWLKLLAFASGASVAALTGTLQASLVGSVFPQDFAFPLLITVYTMVILGGAGSQAGVVLGAILISVLLEVLRDPGDSRSLFYALALLGLVAVFRLSRQLAIVLAGTVLLGFVARVVAGAIDDRWTAGVPSGGGRVGGWASDWVIVPTHLAGWVAPVTYIGLVALVLALTLLQGWTRIVVLVPTLYLAAFVWENVMLAKPEPTRYVVLGAILVGVMIFRPNGLLGERRVEIV
ncbi:MAG TPA: branched-chain amino acid ABC transporter permease, partial [Gaiella sp.]|nr:branched-chain amino acid ABC transporter permease [Gaiella sp.]